MPHIVETIQHVRQAMEEVRTIQRCHLNATLRATSNLAIAYGHACIVRARPDGSLHPADLRLLKGHGSLMLIGDRLRLMETPR